MNVSLDANSMGERIVLAIAVLSICAEMLSDNSCNPVASPVLVEECEALCDRQGLAVKRWESYARECAAEVKDG